jgi:ribonuclease T2
MQRPIARLALWLAIAAAMAGSAACEQNTPGDFDYYVLVLSWSPTYCALEGNKRRDRQCGHDKSHAFVLHGLWPQYNKGWPENCWSGKRPFVPQDVIDAMRDIMPGKGLIIHQYLDHGTCSGLAPAAYFKTARQLYERVSVPPRFVGTDSELIVSPEEIEREFLAANLWLKPDMISITCRGPRLLDIRVCFSRDLAPRACGVNEDQKHLCRARKVAVPPVDGE